MSPETRSPLRACVCRLCWTLCSWHVPGLARALGRWVCGATAPGWRPCLAGSPPPPRAAGQAWYRLQPGGVFVVVAAAAVDRTSGCHGPGGRWSGGACWSRRGQQAGTCRRGDHSGSWSICWWPRSWPVRPSCVGRDVRVRPSLGGQPLVSPAILRAAASTWSASRSSPIQTSAITVTQRPRLSTRSVLPPAGDGTRGVRRNRCTTSHLCELARRPRRPARKSRLPKP